HGADLGQADLAAGVDQSRINRESGAVDDRGAGGDGRIRADGGDHALVEHDRAVRNRRGGDGIDRGVADGHERLLSGIIHVHRLPEQAAGEEGAGQGDGLASHSVSSGFFAASGDFFFFASSSASFFSRSIFSLASSLRSCRSFWRSKSISPSTNVDSTRE